MSFGYSVGDAIKLIEISTKIYLAFNDARQNSASRVHVLVKEFDRFHEFLDRLAKLLQKHGKGIPFGYEDFKKTLLDCQSFIKPYADRLVDKPCASFRGAFRTIQFTFQDEDINRLRAELAGHYQTLTLCMQFMQLELHFESREQAAKFLSLPASSTPVNIRRSPRMESRGSIATIPEHETMTAQSSADEDYHYLMKFHDFLLDQERRLSPASLQARDPFDPSHATSSGAPDQLGVVLSRLRSQVDDALTRAENRVKRARVAGQYVDHPISGSPGQTEIVETPHGSPNIHIDLLENSGSPSSGRPLKFARRPTKDSGLGSDDDEEEAPIHALEGYQWPTSRESRSSVSSTHTVSSYISYGGRTSRTDSFADAITPGGMTPLVSPTALHQNGPPILELPPPAIKYEKISSGAAEFAYKVESEWRKPSPCTVSIYTRQEDDGLSLRTQLQKGAVLQHFPPDEIPIPQVVHDMHHHDTVHITFPLGRLGTIQPKNITNVRYTMHETSDAVRFQELLFGQKLLYSRNVKEVKSDRCDAECRNCSIRLWSFGPVATLLFHTNVRDKGRCWVKERHVAFQELSKSVVSASSDSVKLIFSEDPQSHAWRKLKRSTTASSTHSEVSTLTTGIDVNLNQHKLKWLKIYFKEKDDQRIFVDIWHSYFKPLVDV